MPGIVGSHRVVELNSDVEVCFRQYGSTGQRTLKNSRIDKGVRSEKQEFSGWTKRESQTHMPAGSGHVNLWMCYKKPDLETLGGKGNGDVFCLEASKSHKIIQQ